MMKVAAETTNFTVGDGSIGIIETIGETHMVGMIDMKVKGRGYEYRSPSPRAYRKDSPRRYHQDSSRTCRLQQVSFTKNFIKYFFPLMEQLL